MCSPSGSRSTMPPLSRTPPVEPTVSHCRFHGNHVIWPLRAVAPDRPSEPARAGNAWPLLLLPTTFGKIPGQPTGGNAQAPRPAPKISRRRAGQKNVARLDRICPTSLLCWPELVSQLARRDGTHRKRIGWVVSHYQIAFCGGGRFTQPTRPATSANPGIAPCLQQQSKRRPPRVRGFAARGVETMLKLSSDAA